MSSFKIQLTDPVHISTYRVLYGDTDAGGVVYNANYLRYFELGRSEFMRELVISYSTLEKEGFILPVVETYLRYKAPARYDDLIVIKTSLQQKSGISWKFNHHIHRAGSSRLLVKGFTVHATVSREGKLIKLPAVYRDRLNSVSSPANPV